MIQELKVRNFLSFKDEAILSFEATKDTMLEDSNVVEVAPGVRLLRFAMVMGANASGKSNLLKAVDYLRVWWFARPEDVDEETGFVPFMLNKQNSDKPTEMEIRFWTGGVKYWYQLRLTLKEVLSEKLYVYRSVQPTLVFDRKLQDGHSVIIYNSTVLKVSNAAQDELQVKCLNNMSFFAARQQVNVALPVIDDARDWMRKGIMPLIEPDTRMFDYAVENMHVDKELHDHIINFLHTSDFNISEIKSSEVVSQVPASFLDMILNTPGLSKEEKERMKKEKTIKQLDTTFIHRVENEDGVELHPMAVEDESLGTRRSIGLEAAVYAVRKKEALLNVDEFDSSMHHDLLRYMISDFLSEKGESQLLISTHYLPLLTAVDKIFRRDCVWFTDKGKDGASTLSTLVEFKGLNRMSNFMNAYIDGRFGAKPDIEENK